MPPRRRALRVAVIADRETTVAGPDADATVAPSIAAVSTALRAAGHAPVTVPLGPKPAAWREQIGHGGFDLVFNLCESVAGRVALEHLPAATVQSLGIPLTGAGPRTLALCLHKPDTNVVLRARGVPVPPWTVVRTGEIPAEWRDYPAIVKPAAEDASIGIERDVVVHDARELTAAVARGHRRWNQLLVQRFVDGRELNLAIVGRHVLPPAEIEFAKRPDGMPPIVTYAAKWDPGSPDDRTTIPRCPALLAPRLVDRLERLARTVWRAVHGAGYGRIDVRMDTRGKLFVIDVNPNPDLSPDAGLARQAAAAGWSHADLVSRIVDDALARHTRAPRRRNREAVTA